MRANKDIFVTQSQSIIGAGKGGGVGQKRVKRPSYIAVFGNGVMPIQILTTPSPPPPGIGSGSYSKFYKCWKIRNQKNTSFIFLISEIQYPVGKKCSSAFFHLVEMDTDADPVSDPPE